MLSQQTDHQSNATVEYVTAETVRGRAAIHEAMQHSYAADLDPVPPSWTMARLVDGVPVAWLQIDPDRRMAFPGRDVRYAFVMNVATRSDHRREGHFRALMTHGFGALRDDGCSLAVTHGRYQLYRPLRFAVFTHHSGIFLTPRQITQALGADDTGSGSDLLTVETHRAFHPDLLVVREVRAETPDQCRAALLAAAAVAGKRGKERILFEDPPAPSYGSLYPLRPSSETPYTAAALACGAKLRLEPAEPERGSIPDADRIKVLDAEGFLREAVRGIGAEQRCVPAGTVAFETDAGTATVTSDGCGCTVQAGIQPGVPLVSWPSQALAQWVIGYRGVAELAAAHRVAVPQDALQRMEAWFPRRWRFSRNESWTFAS
jgi:hypothetical protein